MNKLLTLALCAGALVAAEANDTNLLGRVAGMPRDLHAHDQYRASIVAINGEATGAGARYRVPGGKATVTVAIHPQKKWKAAEGQTKNIEVNVTVGHTLYIAAQVDTDATAAQIADGSFWKPVIVREFRSR